MCWVLIWYRRTTDAAYKVFFDTIEAQGRSLLRTELEPADPSLSPPPSLLSHFQVLRSVLSLHASDDASATLEAMSRILDSMVDPAQHTVYSAAVEEKEQRRGRW